MRGETPRRLWLWRTMPMTVRLRDGGVASTLVAFELHAVRHGLAGRPRAVPHLVARISAFLMVWHHQPGKGWLRWRQGLPGLVQDGVAGLLQIVIASRSGKRGMQDPAAGHQANAGRGPGQQFEHGLHRRD